MDSDNTLDEPIENLEVVDVEELAEDPSAAAAGWCLGTAGTFGCPSTAGSYGCLT